MASMFQINDELLGMVQISLSLGNMHNNIVVVCDIDANIVSASPHEKKWMKF